MDLNKIRDSIIASSTSSINGVLNKVSGFVKLEHNKSNVSPVKVIHELPEFQGCCGKQGYKSFAHNPAPHPNRWLRYRYGRMPDVRRPGVDYITNHWIPPYEIPLEVYYYPGYNIVEYPVPRVGRYWPKR